MPENRTSANAAETAPLPELLKGLRDDVVLLTRQEVALAKQEMSDKLGVLGSNSGQLVAGALVAYAGAVVLMIALAAGLYAVMAALGVDPMIAGWLAPLIVGGLATMIGAGMTKKAVETLKNTTAVPERTVETMKENANWAKEKVSP